MKRRHKTNFPTTTDDYIDEVAEWLNQNLGFGDTIEISILVRNEKKHKTSTYNAKKIM